MVSIVMAAVVMVVSNIAIHLLVVYCKGTTVFALGMDKVNRMRSIQCGRFGCGLGRIRVHTEYCEYVTVSLVLVGNIVTTCCVSLVLVLAAYNWHPIFMLGPAAWSICLNLGIHFFLTSPYQSRPGMHIGL